MKRSIILTALSFLVLAQLAWAQVPQTINYQGVLKDGSGNIVANGNYDIAFRLYDGTDTQVWAETHSSVGSNPVWVENGVFSVVLGLVEPLPDPFPSPAKLGIKVGSDVEMSPRIELNSVPFALNAGGISGTSNVFPSDGNVGIGTTTPENTLHVKGWFKLEGSDFVMADPARGDGGRALVHQGDGGGTNDLLILNHNGDFDSGVSVEGSQLTVEGNIIANSSVGIGVSPPTVPLHVYRDGAVNQWIQSGSSDAAMVIERAAAANASALQFATAGSVDWSVITSGNSDLNFKAGGSTDALSLTSSGLVGIGVSPPTAKLHIGGTPGSDGIKFPDGTLQTTASASTWSPTGNDIYYNAGNVGIGTAPTYPLDVQADIIADYVTSVKNTGTGANGGKGLLVAIADTGAAGAGDILAVEGSGNSFFKVTREGKVGVGVANPYNKFQVRDSSYAYAGYFLNSPGTNGLYVNTNASGLGSGATGIYLYAVGGTAGSNTFGLNSNTYGYSSADAHGINSSTYNYGTGPAYGVYSYAYTSGSAAEWSFYGANGNVHVADSLCIGTTSQVAARLSVNGTSYFSGYAGFGVSYPSYRITLPNNASGSGTGIAYLWTTYSSRRWKTNIRTIEGSLDLVRRLRGVSFDWKSNGSHDIGLIAEEVGEVIPEIVTYEENGEDASSLSYSRLVAVLIEAVKELESEKDDLERRMAALETTLAGKAGSVTTAAASVPPTAAVGAP
ncbi:MAG: tail fiber domain-containing protein [Fidelibacterota bacterium]|nr:MAG: tail fiber domain-containing protein [Candidatus Neomarinimicrobiota bacterium]